MLGEEGSYSVLSDRAAIPPFGVAGGGSSHPYRVAVRRNGPRTVSDPRQGHRHPVRRDDVVIMESAGGGGYGDPLERDPETVRADVLAGFVSAERGREGYGVVLDGSGEVDEAATTAVRESSRSTRHRLAVRADETDPYTGVRGRGARSASRPRVRSDSAWWTTIWSSCSVRTRLRSGPGCG